jgi:hypothetical protein
MIYLIISTKITTTNPCWSPLLWKPCLDTLGDPKERKCKRDLMSPSMQKSNERLKQIAKFETVCVIVNNKGHLMPPN